MLVQSCWVGPVQLVWTYFEFLTGEGVRDSAEGRGTRAQVQDVRRFIAPARGQGDRCRPGQNGKWRGPRAVEGTDGFACAAYWAVGTTIKAVSPFVTMVFGTCVDAVQGRHKQYAYCKKQDSCGSQCSCCCTIIQSVNSRGSFKTERA